MWIAIAATLNWATARAALVSKPLWWRQWRDDKDNRSNWATGSGRALPARLLGDNTNEESKELGRKVSRMALTKVPWSVGKVGDGVMFRAKANV